MLNKSHATGVHNARSQASQTVELEAVVAVGYRRVAEASTPGQTRHPSSGGKINAA